MLNMKQLQIFISVAKEKNFTKAASLLYMTQPAISWQIKSLEKDLGVNLFERGDRSVTLTDAGQVFFTYAKKIVNDFEQALAAMDEIKGFQRGNLVIGASTIPGEYILPRLIGGFKKQYPGINISLEIADTAKVIKSILADEVHLGVIGAKVEEDRLSFKPMLKDELILIAPPGHFLIQQETINLNDLIEIPFVMRENGSGTRKAIEECWLASGLKLEEMKVIMELGSTRAVISAVEAGLGVSIVSIWSAEDALNLERICQIPLNNTHFQRHLYIANRQDREIGHLRVKFIDFLLDKKVLQELLPQ